MSYRSQLLTIGEAARLVGLSKHQFVYQVEQGRTPEPYKIAGMRMFDPDDLRDWKPTIYPAGRKKA